MSTRLVVRIFCAVVAVAAVPALWRAWGSVCNEACPPWRSLSMMALSLAMPALCYAAAHAMTALPASRRVVWPVGIGLFASILWALIVSYGA